ncbi:MAG: hypothetical protein KIT72_08575 [Polyangiaceae bacterium]|nr:hypothetical protein [Polyangiaceae bacterium]MCW5790462.1 hypothetical protein [Polyangiaceae bacterium]
MRDDLSAIIDMITDAKERGAFDPRNRHRHFAKPTAREPTQRCPRAMLDRGVDEVQHEEHDDGAIDALGRRRWQLQLAQRLDPRAAPHGDCGAARVSQALPTP